MDSDLKEIVVKKSLYAPCAQGQRAWEQILDIALCKIDKLAHYIPKHHSIYYYKTLYKTESCDEIASI